MGVWDAVPWECGGDVGSRPDCSELCSPTPKQEYPPTNFSQGRMSKDECTFHSQSSSQTGSNSYRITSLNGSQERRLSSSCFCKTVLL